MPTRILWIRRIEYWDEEGIEQKRIGREGEDNIGEEWFGEEEEEEKMGIDEKMGDGNEG